MILAFCSFQSRFLNAGMLSKHSTNWVTFPAPQWFPATLREDLFIFHSHRCTLNKHWNGRILIQLSHHPFNILFRLSHPHFYILDQIILWCEEPSCRMFSSAPDTCSLLSWLLVVPSVVTFNKCLPALPGLPWKGTVIPGWAASIHYILDPKCPAFSAAISTWGDFLLNISQPQSQCLRNVWWQNMLISLFWLNYLHLRLADYLKPSLLSTLSI